MDMPAEQSVEQQTVKPEQAVKEKIDHSKQWIKRCAVRNALKKRNLSCGSATANIFAEHVEKNIAKELDAVAAFAKTMSRNTKTLMDYHIQQYYGLPVTRKVKKTELIEQRMRREAEKQKRKEQKLLDRQKKLEEKAHKLEIEIALTKKL